MAYHTALLCPFVILSNGLCHISLKFSQTDKKFIQTTEFPPNPSFF
jgi:hypothetical protein